MTRIGLTGGIGSGKSTVSGLFARAGALVIDADAIAREVVAPGTPGLAEVAAAFGDGVISPDGSLDRGALAAIVFSNADALATLNAIVHPLVAQRTAELMAGAEPDQVVVHDVPLLVENGLAAAYDLVVVVEAPQDIRLARLAERGVPGDEAHRRMAAQCTDQQRRDVADIVLDNSGDLDALAAQVGAVLARATARR